MRNLHEILTNFLVYVGNIHINANVLCKDKVYYIQTFI